MADIEAILGAASLFGQVRPAGLRRLAAMAGSRTYRKGAIIFRQGQPCAGIYIVARGLVRLYTLAPSGKEHVLHLAGPGQSFAEVAVIGGFECPATAEAVEATSCALLPSEEFLRLLREDHDLCLQLLAGLTLRVRQMVGLLEDLVLRDATGRLARHLFEKCRGRAGEIPLPSLKRHLASHLNLTSETLSRTLRKLADAGIIESRGARALEVLDPRGLERAAEGLFPVL
jgi:CRP/FNR family transcriptional regulator, dissimilatory nitrate respiration regulator